MFVHSVPFPPVLNVVFACSSQLLFSLTTGNQQSHVESLGRDVPKMQDVQADRDGTLDIT
jgi:hypothetical protein